MYAKVNGVEIFYDIDGKQIVWDEEKQCMKEKPVCFVLHGGPGADHYVYGEFFHWLTEYMQLVFIDYRGNGRSSRCDIDTYTIEQNVEDIEALRQYLGLDKIVVMGQSFGGIMTQAYAIAHPDKCLAIIPMCTSPSGELFARASQQLVERATPEMLEYFQNVVMTGLIKDNEEWRRYFHTFAGLYSLYGKETYCKEIDRCVLSVDAFKNKSVQEFDFRPDLHKITCPTLVIGGEEDWICPISEFYEIVDRIPGAKSIAIKDSSHEIFLDQPDQTREVLDKFVKEVIVPMTTYIASPMTQNYKHRDEQ